MVKKSDVSRVFFSDILLLSWPILAPFNDLYNMALFLHLSHLLRHLLGVLVSQVEGCVGCVDNDMPPK